MKLIKKTIEKYEKKFDKYEKNKWIEKALEIIDDNEKITYFNNLAYNKIKKIKEGPIKEIFGQMEILFYMVKDIVIGDYMISRKNLIFIIAGILYFINPFEMITDFIPIVGYLDDIAVINYVMGRINVELKNYYQWKNFK